MIHAVEAERPRLSAGDMALTVWAIGTAGAPSRRCRARQALGVWPDQRRKARVKALASE